MTAIFVAKTLFVDPAYGDDNSGVREDESRPFATVAVALSQAASGDVVLMRPGTYNLPAGVTLPSGVTVRGQAPAAVVLHGREEMTAGAAGIPRRAGAAPGFGG